MKKQYTARRVRSRGELEQALALVHDRYVEQGYMKPYPSGIRIGPHFALPETRTFAGFVGANLVSTVTLFTDSGLGLPLDSAYPGQLDEWRDRGRKLAEAGMLADRREEFDRGIRDQLRILRLVYWTCVEKDVDDLLVGVNPRHVGFYTRVLCFEKCGSTRTYTAVRGAPVVLLRLDVSKARPSDVPREGVRRLFLPAPAPDELYSGYRMTPEDIPYFFLEKTNLLRALSRRQREVIGVAHGGLDVSAMFKELIAEPVPAVEAIEREWV